MIARSFLAALAATTGVSALVARGVCNADNCLRALRAASPKTRLAQAQADCAAYLTVTSTPVTTVTDYDLSVATTTIVEEVTATQSVLDTFISTIRETPTSTVYTATITVTVDPAPVVSLAKRAAAPTIPAYASPCSGAVRYSSACSCIGAFTATTVTAATSTTTVTLPSTISTTARVTSVVSTSTTTIYDTTTTVTVTDAAATVSAIATETVTKTSTSSAAPAEPTNLLSNVGFENTESASPWVQAGRSPLSLSTSVVHNGGQSAAITYASGDALVMLQRVTVDANQNYAFTIWARQNTLACQRVYVACGTTNPNNFFGVAFATGDQVLNQWVQISTQCSWNSARVPDAAVTIRLPNNCLAGQTVFFDDASLFKL
ncbi:hypothetical protein HJFPF1_13057 [Paramyrothecium foliicola]|nr:hypothetical protein HJFPF1_13057 [Paramyrothecium foliicola]